VLWENRTRVVEATLVEKTGMDELPSLMCLANEAIDDALGVTTGNGKLHHFKISLFSPVTSYAERLLDAFKTMSRK
jgi:hypothetical protein